jgi:hypothetical protein
MVEITYLAIAGIVLTAMFFGYGFGLFEGRNQGYKKRKIEEAAKNDEKPAPEPVTIQVDDPGLLRIKNENGYLTLDLDGSRVDTTALTVEERKRLIEMLNLMRPWLEGRHAAAPVRTSPPPESQSRPVADARQSVAPRQFLLLPDLLPCLNLRHRDPSSLQRRTAPFLRPGALSHRSIRSCRRVWRERLSRSAASFWRNRLKAG